MTANYGKQNINEIFFYAAMMMSCDYKVFFYFAAPAFSSSGKLTRKMLSSWDFFLNLRFSKIVKMKIFVQPREKISSRFET